MEANYYFGILLFLAAGIVLFISLISWKRRQLTAAFDNSAAQFKSAALERVFESMADGVILLDFEKHIINFNKASRKIIPELNSVTSSQNKASHFLQRYPALLEAIDKAEDAEFEQDILKDGTAGNFLVKASSVSEKEAVLGKILVLSDITDRKKNHDRLTAASAQLAALNTLKDKLITVVTNDIRDPLAILVNLSELLAEELKYNNDDSSEIMDEVREKVRKAYYMVENLAKWFRNKNGDVIFTPKEWRLSELVQEAVQMANIKAKVKNIRIVSDIPETALVFSDKEMLDLVLRNLLFNAVKFTDRNGSISISAVDDKEMVVVSVKDTGVGIPPEKVQLLFQDIHDNSTAGTEGEKGIGLGLFICSEFIKRCGGDIWVDSTPGEGSTFFVSIPANDKGA